MRVESGMRVTVVGRKIAEIGFRVIAAALVPAMPAMADPGPPFKKSADRPVLRAAAVNEASGMAAAHGGGGYWLINDSGSAARLHRIGPAGEDLGSVAVEGVTNRDWEDLAGFEWKGKPHLLIADVGDNAAQHDSCTLIAVEEPVATAGKPLAGSVAPVWSIRFRYPDGPRDCESVAVDAKAGKIVLLSKRDRPPRLYELPLRPAGDGIQTAVFVGTTRVPPPRGTLHPYGEQPTAMDFSPDGRRAAVLSYVGVFVFERAPGEPWAKAFAKNPVMLEPHRLRQAEALAFSRDGQRLIAVSEGLRSPLVIYQKP